MKKNLIILIAVLIGIFVVLTLLDSSQYKIEKKLWKVQQQFVEIQKDPKVVPEQKFESVANQYRMIINKFPDSDLVPNLYAQIGKIYLLKKDYVAARQSYQEIIKKYPNQNKICAEAMLNIAVTYELEDKIKEAANTLKEILDSFPDTDVGLNMPLYTANFYLRVKRPNEAKTEFRNAASYYKKMAAENSESAKGFNAVRMLAATYLAQKEWSQAVNTFGEILIKYANSGYLSPHRAKLTIQSINTVSISQLKDYDVPIKIYTSFITQHPEHPLVKPLRDVISGLEQLKKKNITVRTKE